MSDTVLNFLKAQQWERAKGELRAFVAMLGSCPANLGDADWEQCEKSVEEFIADFENRGLNE